MSGERIKIVGGPWPERIGSLGYVVADPGDGIYPFDKRLRDEVVVKLDDDPLGAGYDTWTCVIRIKDVKWLPKENDQ